jgi:hypothetical protein
MGNLFIVRSGLGRSVRGRWVWRACVTSVPCPRKLAEREAERLRSKHEKKVRDDRDKHHDLEWLVVVEPAP